MLGSFWKPKRGLTPGSEPEAQAIPARSLSEFREPQLDPSGIGGFIGFFVSAGLLNSVIVAVLLCKLPDSRAPSISGTLVRAAAYVALGVMAGVAGAYFYWRRSGSPFRLNPPISFELFALLCAAGWAWVPAAVLLSAQDSAGTALIGGLAGALIAFGLRQAIPPGREPEARPLVEGGLFGATLAKPVREVHGYVISGCIYAAAYAVRDRSNLTAAALLAVSTFLFTWKWKQPRSPDAGVNVRRRAGWGLARAAVPAILVTAWALLLGVARRERGGDSAYADSSDGSGVRAREVRGARSAGPGGYESIILWPLLPRKQIIPPLPSPTNLLGPERSRPLVIRFDGNYWYFQPPEERPSRTAHQAHGTPLTVNIHANNDFPLMMEAHQRLIAPVRLSRCRELDVSIENKDNVPRSMALAVQLADSGYPSRAKLYLGKQVIESSQPGRFSMKTAPVFETLRFAIPPRAAIRKFDEITVILFPDGEQSMTGPKIAVEQFEVLPR